MQTITEGYYKPEYHEFCIGAYYYVPILDEDYRKTNSLARIVIKNYEHYIQNFNLSRVDDYVEKITPPDGALMKYLDEGDFKELGFDNITGLYEHTFEQYEKPEIYTIHYNDPREKDNIIAVIKAPSPTFGKNNWCLIIQGHTSSMLSEWDTTRFSGNIRNKHELEVLLKQLSVTFK